MAKILLFPVRPKAKPKRLASQKRGPLQIRVGVPADLRQESDAAIEATLRGIRDDGATS